MLKRALIFLSAWVYVCKWLWRRLFASRIFSFLIVWKLMMFFFFVLTCLLLFRKQNQKKNTDKTSEHEITKMCVCANALPMNQAAIDIPLHVQHHRVLPKNQGISFTKIYSTSAILWRVQIQLLAENWHWLEWFAISLFNHRFNCKV